MKKNNIDFDYDFIMMVKKMKTIGDFCRENNIHYSNLMKNYVSKEKKRDVAYFLATQILYLYGYAVAYLSGAGGNNEKTDSL